MDPRAKKLAKLLDVHAQLKEFHESRRAGFLQAEAQAKADAEAIARRFDAADSLSGMFPELYHAHIAAALAREAEARASAEAEAAKLAEIALREKSIREALRQAAARAERASAERAVLDWVESRIVLP